MKKFIFTCICCYFVAGYSQGLVVREDSYGISFLSYNKTILLDKKQGIGAPFSTEGCKIIRKNGKQESMWSYMSSHKHMPQNKAWNYVYNFGELLYQYRQIRDTLFITLTITNTSKSDTLAGVNIIPLLLQFPQRPKGFVQYNPYYHYNLDAPTIVPADFNTGKLVLSNEESDNAVFVGLLDANSKEGKRYKVWVSAIPFNGMQARSIPNLEARVAPGRSLRYRLALRFYSSGTPDNLVAPTVIARFKAKNNVQFSWKDKRPIGSLFLSSVSKSDTKNNPRGWLPGLKVSVNNADGLYRLKQEIMAYAKKSISILKDMNAQGMITWDIEGQEFPHAISYVGSPDKLRQVAPEMDKIADEYFALFRKAGLRTGICIRPQEFILSKDGHSAKQQTATDAAAVLIRKIKYARQRWGCTLFYIDSNLDEAWGLMNAAIFKKVHEAVPDVLLIPEHQNSKYFEYSAPYEELRTGTTVIGGTTTATYPSSFMVLNTAEGIYDARGKRLVSDEVLKKSLQQGNIFLFRAWYDDQPANGIIKRLYSEVYKNSANKPGK